MISLVRRPNTESSAGDDRHEQFNFILSAFRVMKVFVYVLDK